MARFCLLSVVCSFFAAGSVSAQQAQTTEGAFRDKPLAFWVGMLKEADPLLREEGLEVIATLGTTAKEAFSHVEALLKDDVPSVRFKAALVALKLRPNFEGGFPIVRASMKSANKNLRKQAFQAFIQLGSDGPETVSILLESSFDPEPGISKAGRDELVRLGAKATPALTKLLDDQDAERRRQAMALLLRQGPAAKSAVGALIERLKHADWDTRLEAARALWIIDRRFQEAATVWNEALEKPSAVLRSQVFDVLAHAKPLPMEVRPGIEAALKDGSVATRLQALRIMQTLDPKHPGLLPVLQEALQDSAVTYNYRSQALRAVIKMGPAARPLEDDLVKIAMKGDPMAAHALAAALGKGAVPHLVKLIRDKKSAAKVEKKRAAFSALAMIGADAVDTLAKLLEDPDREVRLGAVSALDQIGPQAKGAIEPLSKMLKDADVTIVQIAAHGLGRMGKDGRSAIPALLEALKPSSGAALPVVLAALESIGADAKEVAAALHAGLKHDNRPYRIQTATALWRLERNAKPLLPVVLELIEDDATMVAAMALLAEMGAEAKDAVPVLVKLMEKKAWRGRYLVMDTLGKMGAAAKTAGPALKAALADQQLRFNAAMALQKIGVEVDAAFEVLVDIAGKSNLVGVTDVLKAFGPRAIAAAPTIRALIDDNPQPVSRLALMEVLCAIDPQGMNHVRPKLLEYLRGDNRFLAWRAAVLLSKADPKDVEGRQHILKELEDKPAQFPHWPIEQVGKLAGDGKFAVPVLIKFLHAQQPHEAALSKAGFTRETASAVAALSLWRITGETADVLPVLVEILRKDEPGRSNVARHQAARALGEMGPAAKEALGPLLDVHRYDSDAGVRQVAWEAARKIDPKNAPFAP